MVGIKTLLFVLSLPLRRTATALVGPLLVFGIKAGSLLVIAVLAVYLTVAGWFDSLRHRARSLR